MKRINLDRIESILYNYIEGKEHRMYEILAVLSEIAGEECWEQLSEELEKLSDRQMIS